MAKNAQPTPRRLDWNGLISLLKTILSTPIALFVGVLMANRLGDEKYGAYALIVSFLFVFRIVGDMGVNRMLIRDLAQFPGEAADRLGRAVGLKLVLGPLNFLACNLIALIFRFPPDFRWAIFWASTQFLIGFTTAFQSAYNARRKTQFPTALLFFLDTIGFAVSAVWVLKASGSVFWLVAIRALTACAPHVILTFASRRFVRPNIRFDWVQFKPFLRESAPVGIIGLSSILYQRIDLFFIGLMMHRSDAGQYFAAVNLAEALDMLPLAFSAALFPILSRCLKSKDGSFVRVVNQSLKMGALLYFPTAVFCTLQKEPIIDMAFRLEQYPDAAQPLSLLAWKSSFLFFNAVLFAALSAMGRQGLYLYATLIGLILNAVGNVIFIPMYGINAAAAATLGANVFVFAVATGALYSFGHTVQIEASRKIVGGSLVMGLIVAGFHGWLAPIWGVRDFSGLSHWPLKIVENAPLFAAAALGGVLLLAVVRLMRILNAEDIALLRAMIRPRVITEIKKPPPYPLTTEN